MSAIASDPEATRAAALLAAIPADGLFSAGQAGGAPFRVAPAPFTLPSGMAEDLRRQGPLWLKFLKGCNALYHASVRGEAPGWVAEYLDAGKPKRIVEYGRMNRFRSRLPVVLRPDLLLTAEGLLACELDSVPGGIGLLACLQGLYARQGAAPLGGADGMLAGMARALAFAAGTERPATAIVVSDESQMYRPEMRWLAEALRARGLPAWSVMPAETAAGDGGAIAGAAGRLDLVYRFFELFDLPNVPGGEALLEAAKLKRVRLTPPPKAFLEEKLLLALLHHPAVAGWWAAALGDAGFAELRGLVVPTWVLDPRPLPPHAAIPGLAVAGRAVQSFAELDALSQHARAFVLKPSGFSADAWGSHGVRIGPDLSSEDWARALREALAAFPDRPWVLQPYRKPSRVPHRWYDPAAGAVRASEGRVRLCPYYFVTGEDAVELGGVLATICPAEKKAVHGMPEAVMVPAA